MGRWSADSNPHTEPDRPTRSRFLPSYSRALPAGLFKKEDAGCILTSAPANVASGGSLGATHSKIF
jgi:hypothetical protein